MAEASSTADAARGPRAWLRAWPDLLAFAAGIAVARWGAWQTADLVWSLWLSSLVVGYASILWGALGPGLRQLRAGETGAGIVALTGGAYMVAFFTLHFGMFHAVHAMFLNMFFPLIPQLSAPDPALLLEAARHYWWFLPAAFVAERRNFAVEPMPPEPPRSSVKSADIEARTARRRAGQAAMHRPYVNVVRMHLLIFVFAAVHVAGIESFAVYVLVYAVYFFPWRLLRESAPQAAPA